MPLLPLIIGVVIVFIGIFALILIAPLFMMAGGFEIEQDSGGQAQAKMYCVYSYDDNEYVEKMYKLYGISESKTNELLTVSMEKKADPTLNFALIRAYGQQIDKKTIEDWSNAIYSIYTKNQIFSSSDIIYNYAPEERYTYVDDEGEEHTDYRKSPSFINAANEIMNTLKPAMRCDSETNLANSSGPIQGGGFSLPLAKINITSKFGYRIDPFTGASALHRGTDFGCTRGEPVYSVLSGIVYESTTHNSWGNYVLTHDGNNVYLLYAHLDTPYVSKGQTITAGTPLGSCGSTGDSTGPHLHLEVQLNSPYGTLIDPQTYFYFGG